MENLMMNVGVPLNSVSVSFIKRCLTNVKACTQLRFKRIDMERKWYYDINGNSDHAVQQVVDRFKRLRWGGYVHARPSRHRGLYRKPAWLREQLREHIATPRAMSFLMDNMLNSYWKAPQYYPDDPYEPYHTRTGVPWDYDNKRKKFFP